MSLVHQLNNGVSMPMIGFGTFRIVGTDKIFSVIKAALEVGYRSFDTAAVYRNESDIGAALQKYLPMYGLKREDIFLTSKLAPDNNSPCQVAQAVENSLQRLQTPYLDLYLIHWPGAAGLPAGHKDNTSLRRSVWSELVKLYRKGKFRALGVSNYTVRHIEELLSTCEGVPPTVNQVEYHPHFQQTDLLIKCKEANILLQAYSSFGGSGNVQLLNDPVVQKIAERNAKSPAQVLLRWALQHDVGVIPKAEKEPHIISNFQLDFKLSGDDMKQLDNISTVQKYAWNPEVKVAGEIESLDKQLLNQKFADRVACLCHSKYASLPKRGKPKKDLEWTMLSAVVVCAGGVEAGNMDVVSLATGSKCVGINKMSPKGDILNDSHAEVLARRGFLRYLYQQIHLIRNGSSSEVLLENADKKYTVGRDISFHLYCSHTPCGDASIIPKTTFSADEDEFGVCLSNPLKRISDDGDSRTTESAKRLKQDQPRNDASCDKPGRGLDSDWNVDDIHRTGAKCIANDAKQDEHLPGHGYHVLGAVRTKPGRGDPTLSVSCSDKIMRWNCVGLQGALLSLLLAKPVYLKSIVIGGGCPFSSDALKRALVDRVMPARSLVPSTYIINSPVILQANIPFPDGRFSSKASQPCPSSLIWCNVPQRNLEVAVEGKKEGATKKCQNTRAGRLLVSKIELLRLFESVIGSQSTRRSIEKNDAKDTVSSSARKTATEDSSSVTSRRLMCDNDNNVMKRSFEERAVIRGNNEHTKNTVNCCDKISGAKYSAVKTKAFEYRSTWATIRSAAELSWTSKNPMLLEFSTDDEERH